MGRNEFSDDSLETTVMGRYPKPGTRLLDKYIVDSLIGTGGMGCVIKAKHVELQEWVAIKCLLPEMMDRKEVVQRFLREARAAVKLKGEHVARVHDVGRFPDNNVPYIIMEYLDGADLGAIIKHHGAQDPAIACDLLLQACEAIAEAHSLGIIHRDIKSSNFFVSQPPNQAPILKVLDFGIATAPEGTSDLTSTQSVIGTPSYMAPEQMRSASQVDVRSDIWSLGVVLYELLEGARPFRSDVYSELCLKVGMDPPQPMVNPEVTDVLRQIVMKCLEKPMERRYQNVAELAFDLMQFASDPVAARAAAEQCARLLGRRGVSTIHQVPSWDGGSKPIPRVTPAGGIPVPSSPISTSQAGPPTPAPTSTVLGRPTPSPTGSVKTPTSIGSSSGEVQTPPSVVSIKPQRSGLVIAITAITVLLVVGGGAYLASSQGWFGGDKTIEPVAHPLPEPPPTTELDRTPAPPKAADVKHTDVDTSAKPSTDVKPPPTDDKPDVKPPPPAVKPPPVVKSPPVVKQPPPVVKPPPPVVKPPPPVVKPPAPGGSMYEKRN